jgi:3-oxoacyl-[acyl-carrier-protein] synthase II
MKVFVTGMGALTSLGTDVNTMFHGLIENRCGVQAYPDWRAYNGLNSFLGAPVGEYDISKLPRTVRRSMSRMSEMASLATFQALEQAYFPQDKLNSPRTLIILGSTTGSPATLETYFRKLIERNGPEGQVSTSFFKIMNHSVAANVAAALEFSGAVMSPSSACATSTQAVVIGQELIKAGLYDVVIAGGADELHYMSAAIFDIVQAASRKYNDTPLKASRPFDQDRDGLVVSEGAAVVVMESEKFATSRGARLLAEVRGGIYMCDGSHMTQSSSETMASVMNLALEKCGLVASDIDYVNAHATSTIHGDAEEAQAIGKVFGNRTPVSSLKGHFGHSLAACGALEMIASIKMMEHEMLIPTRNLEIVDPTCGDIQLIQKNQVGPVRAVLSNNFAFGGMNTCLVVSKV